MKIAHQTRAAAAALATALAAAGCFSSDGRCATSASCAEGELCYAGACVAALPAGSCTPPQSATPVAGGTSGPASEPTCDPVSAPPAPVAAFDSGWQTHLGTFDVGDRVTFPVPEGTASVTIHSQATAAAQSFSYFGYLVPNSVVPTDLRAPNGGLAFDDLAPIPQAPWFDAAYYGGFTPWTGSFTFPATARLLDFVTARGELPAGDWSFQVNDWNAECPSFAGCAPGSPAGNYDVTVVTRPGPFVSTGTLDLAVYLVTGAGPSAASAAANPAYQRFVDGVARVLGQSGICLGTVTFFDVPAWAKAPPYSTVNICDYPPCGELSRLFSLASPSADAVHLFLVDVLDAAGCGGSGGGTIVGIDGSIPGPSGLPGARTSGAAMSHANIGAGTCGAAFDISQCGADQSAYIAAHEIGHWLGLYHTTEATGDTFDPLSDTGTCACDACGFGGCETGFGMAPADCSSSGATCAGGDNLMFWVLDPSWSQGQLSAQQGLVMRLNPAVK